MSASVPIPTVAVLEAVARERKRQDAMWGRAPGEWFITDAEKFVVLVEEVGEVARALNDGESVESLVAELVQVAAVAVCWAETLKRKV